MNLLYSVAWNSLATLGLWSLIVTTAAGGPALPWWGAIVIGIIVTIAESMEKPDEQD